MAKRITAIVGAGAAVELAPASKEMPSTGNITRRLVNKAYTDSISKADIDLVKRIYMRLYRKRLDKDKKTKSKDYYSTAHFEKIFHILESLYAFDNGWDKAQNPTMVPPFSSVVRPTLEHDANQVRTVIYDYIQEIMEIVNEYDSAFEDNTNVEWYKSFWKGLKEKLDVFTFNYDTTIEQSVKDYIDGFVDVPESEYNRFEPRILIDSTEEKTYMNHVHGCIMYGHPFNFDSNYDHEDLFKFKTYSDSKENYDRIRKSNSSTQAGEEIVMGPIITGLHKTEKTLCLPYDIYAKNLASKIITNNRILIIGYSFGDYYVNKMLERINLLHGDDYKVVLIDYWPSLKGHIELENDSTENLVIYPNMMDHYIEDWDDKYNINHNELAFICKVAGCNRYDLWNNMTGLSLDGPIRSKNGRLMLFLGKFSDVAKNYTEEIYKFLE